MSGMRPVKHKIQRLELLIIRRCEVLQPVFDLKEAPPALRVTVTGGRPEVALTPSGLDEPFALFDVKRHPQRFEVNLEYHLHPSATFSAIQ